MKGAISLASMLLFSFPLAAQVEREDPPVGNNPVIRIQEQRIYGKVTDSRSGQGMAAATVQLFKLLPSGRDSLISSQFTRSNGD